MKKFMSAILVLTLLLAISSMCFAATDTVVTDPQIPGAPAGQNTNDENYVEEADQVIPGNPADSSVKGGETATVVKEEVPKAPAKLPKTGGIPAEAFYVAGALIVVAALILSKVKSKPATKS